MPNRWMSWGVLAILLPVTVIIFTACPVPVGDDSSSDPGEPRGGESPEEPADLAAMDSEWIPFAGHTAYAASGYMTLPTPAGNSLYTIIHPWRVHAIPYTGHNHGKVMGDWSGFFVMSKDDANYEYDSVDPSIELGIPKTYIDANTPWYESPIDNLTITRVELQSNTEETGGAYGNEKWIVKGTNGTVVMRFEHLKSLHDTFRTAVANAGNPLPSSSSPLEQNLITNPFTIGSGDLIGQPQVRAMESPNSTEHLVGLYDESESPIVLADLRYCQIEYSIDSAGDEIAYNKYHLSQTSGATFLAMMEKSIELGMTATIGDMFYADYWYCQGEAWNWTWKSETALGPEYVYRFRNDNILGGLGSWFEVQDTSHASSDIYAYTPGNQLNDDSFLLYQVNTSSAVYDPGDYDSSDVSFIAAKHSYSDNETWIFGQVVETANLLPGPDAPASGQLKIHWLYDTYWGTFLSKYQSVSFVVDPATYSLLIHWGPESDTEAGATYPALPTVGDTPDPNDTTPLVLYKQYGLYAQQVYNLH